MDKGGNFLSGKYALSVSLFVSFHVILRINIWQKNLVQKNVQLAGGMWPNCLGALSKAGIRCLHQLVVEGGKF